MDQFRASSSRNDIYFAANTPKETASILLGKSFSFYNTLRANAYLDKIAAMWRAYYGVYGGTTGDSHRVSFTGEQGELVQLPVNHFRNIAQHMLVMITSNRPIMEARAVNTDYKSLAQTYLANNILDYYMREKKLEDHIKTAAEMAIVLGSGFIKMEWNSTAGEAFDVDPDTGEFSYEGEIEFSNLSPFDVVVDGTRESWNGDWVLVRTFQNRFDLMAKYPEMKDKIKGLPSKTESSVYRMAVFSNDDTDDIPVYEFYHKRTEALPDGRYMLFLDSDCILLDTKMPYRTLPIFRIAPSNILGTPYGYSSMFDIYPIQEGINSTYSTIMTNQAAFGVQNLYVPRGADIAVNTLDGAMNIIEGNQKPESLNLTQTPEEIFKFLGELISAAETVSGVNSVTRGNPEASLTSGNSLALVQSMALQFISGLQQSYVKLIEDIGTALINILKDFANTPKVITLVGKNNRPYLKEFTGEDINSINRVIVDVGNPLSRTIAGRVQMAEQLLQMGAIKSPQQYFQVMNTGRLDVMFEGEMDELLFIKQENERLMEGREVIASPLDQHRLHIQEHRCVISDPDLRFDPELSQKVLDHIQEHINLLRTTDPDLLMLIGEQPLQSPPPPQALGPQGPIPLGQPAPMNAAPVLQSPVQGFNPQVSMPNLPNPPAPFENLPVVAGQIAQ